MKRHTMEKDDGIPKVSFLKRRGTKVEFDVLKLEELFSKKEKLKPPLDKPQRVEFYQIFFIHEGTGTHFVDFQSYSYSKGDVLFVSKDQIQTFEINPDTKGIMMLFTPRFLSKNLIHSDVISLYRLYNYNLYPPLIKSRDVKSCFTKLVEEVIEEFKKPDDFAREEILRLLLKLILLKAERINNRLLPQTKNSNWLAKSEEFRKHLQENYQNTRNAKDYAVMMGLSYKNLNDICKNIAGCTAKEFIDNFVILEIKRSLATSDISVKELTYHTGFDEPTNFVKYFKKHTGQSPTLFKQLIST